MLLMTACVSLGSCVHLITANVDTSCEWTERGTAHPDDTPITKRWMFRYEVNRRQRCPDNYSKDDWIPEPTN